jgi:hypothetical protein
VQNGFSWFGLLHEKFINLGGNLKDKLSILREMRGIGAKKFVAM